jgi:rod shape-determining protein MreC
MAFLENHRRAFLLSGIGVCIVAIILTINPGIGTSIISGGLSIVVTPLQSGISSSASWAQGHFSALTNNQRLITENRELLAEINRLEFENHRLNLLAEDNTILSAALNINQQYLHLPTIGARVIAHDPNNWYRSFRIDRGSNDGIAVGMPIIAGGGLAGEVRYVNPTSSQFVSILDSRFSAAVTAPRTGDFGIAEGDTTLMQQGLLRMNIKETTTQIMPGDEILTSSESTKFPAGLLLGEVQSIHTSPDGLTRFAIIRPVATLDDLEIVHIINEVFGDGNAVRDSVNASE